MTVNNFTILGCLPPFSPSSCGPVDHFYPNLARWVTASTVQERGEPAVCYRENGPAGCKRRALLWKLYLEGEFKLGLHLVGNEPVQKPAGNLTSSLPFLLVLLALCSASCWERAGRELSPWQWVQCLGGYQRHSLGSVLINALRFSLVCLWEFCRVNVFSCWNLLRCDRPGRTHCFLHGWLELCALLAACSFAVLSSLDDWCVVWWALRSYRGAILAALRDLH